MQNLSQANALAARLLEEKLADLRRDGLEPVVVDLSSDGVARFEVYGCEEDQENDEPPCTTFLVVRNGQKGGSEQYAVQETAFDDGYVVCHVAPGVWFCLDTDTNR